jgi:hypothetical protein
VVLIWLLVARSGRCREFKWRRFSSKSGHIGLIQIRSTNIPYSIFSAAILPLDIFQKY